MSNQLLTESIEMLKKVFEIVIDEKRREEARCLQAIQDEPEMPGDMPDKLYEALKTGDREVVTFMCRLIVVETKRGIIKRIVEGRAQPLSEKRG